MKIDEDLSIQLFARKVATALEKLLDKLGERGENPTQMKEEVKYSEWQGLKSLYISITCKFFRFGIETGNIENNWPFCLNHIRIVSFVSAISASFVCMGIGQYFKPC